MSNDNTTSTSTTPDAAPDAVDQALDTTPPAAGDDLTADQDATDSKAGRDAAKYRARLREVEAERDGIRGHLDAARRTLVEHQLGNCPAAGFWALNPAVDALLDDAGQLDAAKIAEAASSAFTALGIAGQFTNTAKGKIGPYLPMEGGTPSTPIGITTSFATAFAPHKD